MVQTFSVSPTPSSASMIGDALGQGVNRNFPDPQQLVQRGMLQKALEKARGTINQPGTTPLDQALSVAEAFAGIPGSDRFLSSIMPALMQRSQAQNTPSVAEITGNNPPLGGGQQNQMQPTGGSPMQAQPTQAAQASPIKPGEQPSEPMSLGSYLPYNIEGLITPQQADEIITRTSRSGGDSQTVRQRISDYNKGLIDLTDLANTNVDKGFAVETRSRKFLDEQLGDTPVEFKNIAYNLLKKKLPGKDMTTAWRDTKKDYEDLVKNIGAFQAGITKPDTYVDSMGMTQSKQAADRAAAKNLLKKDPLIYNILEKQYLDKGHSIYAPAKILNPLPKEVNTIIEKQKDYTPSLFKSGLKNFFRPMDEKQMLSQITDDIQQQKDEVPSLIDKLKNNWSDTLSLTNITRKLREKGWYPESINYLFELLSDQVPIGELQGRDITSVRNGGRIPLNYLED